MSWRYIVDEVIYVMKYQLNYKVTLCLITYNFHGMLLGLILNNLQIQNQNIFESNIKLKLFLQSFQAP